MITWRGWGVLPILIAAFCVALGVAMSPSPQLRSIFVGLMLIAGGVGTWSWVTG